MARPRKFGLEYFALDVDFFEDEKIAAISGEFGIKGEIITLRLLCAIYRQGYFLEWTDMIRYKLVRAFGGAVSVALLDQVVAGLVRWGFFDKSLFDSARVLTSAGIQRRYFASVRKRTLPSGLPHLIVSAPETPVSAPKTEVSGGFIPQSKVKNIKKPPDGGKEPRPPAPEKAGNYDRTPAQEAERMLTDVQWREPVCMSFGITSAELDSRIRRWQLSCDKHHTSEADARSHLVRWMERQYGYGPSPETRITKSTKPTGNEKSGTDTWTLRRGTDAGGPEPKDYGQPF